MGSFTLHILQKCTYFSGLNIIKKNTDCCIYFFTNLISVQLIDCRLNVACESDVRGAY